MEQPTSTKSVCENSNGETDTLVDQAQPSVIHEPLDYQVVTGPRIPNIQNPIVCAPGVHSFMLSEMANQNAFYNQKPDDYLCWSIFSVIFCNLCCCLGWFPLYFSIKSRSALKANNRVKAVAYGQRAKSFNKKLLYAGLFAFMVFIVRVMLVIFKISLRTSYSYSSNEFS